MFKDLDKCSRYYKLFFYFFKYKWLFLRCKKKKVKKKYKIGIIGELYTLMDSDANNNIEKYLKDYGVEITRFMNFSNLIFFNKCDGKKSLGDKNKYLKYHLGATATYTIKNALYFAKHHYDGILHLKSSFCTPEISAMAILNRISNDYDIPIAYFSFDTENSDEAMKTRLEAFLDMIKMRRDRNE